MNDPAIYYDPSARVYYKSYEQSGGLTFVEVVKVDKDAAFKVGTRRVFTSRRLRDMRRVSPDDAAYMDEALNDETLARIAGDVGKANG